MPQQVSYSYHNLCNLRSIYFKLDIQTYKKTSSSLSIPASMVVDALIYHPSVAHYLRYVATTSMSPQHLSFTPVVRTTDDV
jgi:hypothetical protein